MKAKDIKESYDSSIFRKPFVFRTRRFQISQRWKNFNRFSTFQSQRSKDVS
jgi:hypothetical protein